MKTKREKTIHEKIMNTTLIALFGALCYIVLAVLFIPFANMYIHFGNLVVVLAALLIGGWQGGLAGSLGMGLFDLLNGHADSAPKTILLKFLIGLIVGLVFKALSGKGKFPKRFLAAAGSGALLLSVMLLFYMLAVTGRYAGRSAYLCPLFLVVSVFCFAVLLLSSRLSTKTACATVAAVCGMAVNIAGEFLWKLFYYLIAGSHISAAITTAALEQASTLINAALAIIGGVALYSLLKKPFSRISRG